jgi:glucose/arabinose dehydrogenase
VAHAVLPRQWVGRRLLRFLAGLAMLALAVTAPAFAAPAVPAPAPVSVAAEPAPVAEIRAAAPAVVERVTAPAPVATALVVLLAVMLIPAGLTLRVRAERAPPAG